jgi:hypothetical protein
VDKPRRAGMYTDQRLNLSKLWEGPRKKCQGFKPDPGNPAVRDYRGASGNVSHGGNVHRLRSKERETEPPHRELGAPGFYPNRRRKREPTGNTNIDLNRRASLRPYQRCRRLAKDFENLTAMHWLSLDWPPSGSCCESSVILDKLLG